MSYYVRDGIAVAIIHEGQRRGITQKGIEIALATGLVESDLVMHCNENDAESQSYPWDAISYDYDSSGIFQQRPAYWGTAQQRMDVAASAGMFYDSLVAQRIGDQDYNTDATTPGGWAYMVQQCAEEYAYRYDERYPEACELYGYLAWMECPLQPGECRVSGAPGPLVSQTWLPENLVGERVLAYDHSIVPQETGYWCGPAATQVVLNEAGVYISEQDLANQMGTDSNGTDYIGIITDVLNGYVPEAIYTTVDLPIDPPSLEQKERLWADIIRSVNAGWGIVMNWVAPPGNKPIGIKGSPNPSYGGGTTYHYVSCLGYDDNPDLRGCWIADSGFSPFNYWCAFDQVATLIPPKGYSYAAQIIEGEIDMANVPQEQWDKLVADVTDIRTQLRGPNDQGWEVLGQNQAGQNLSVVDALGSVKHTVEGQPPPFPERAQTQENPRRRRVRPRIFTPS